MVPGPLWAMASDRDFHKWPSLRSCQGLYGCTGVPGMSCFVRLTTDMLSMATWMARGAREAPSMAANSARVLAALGPATAA